MVDGKRHMISNLILIKRFGESELFFLFTIQHEKKMQISGIMIYIAMRAVILKKISIS